MCHTGGFGVAKNLSNWATKGKDYSITPEIEKVIKGFHQAKKPMGMCCISPVLAAKAIPGCEITVGHDCECEKWVWAISSSRVYRDDGLKVQCVNFIAIYW